jgi:hypothetical protein
MDISLVDLVLHTGMLFITDTNRIDLVLLGMQNRTLHPYLAAASRTLTLVMHCCHIQGGASCAHIQNRTLRPYGSHL